MTVITITNGYNGMMSYHNMQAIECNWTEADTAICESAEASGLSINLTTGNPTTLHELVQLRKEYQQMKDTVVFDEFIKRKLSSKPFA